MAPTRECVELLREVERETGEEVALVLLPTTLLEHKQFLAPFASRFPRARVLVAPGQYGWPVPNVGAAGGPGAGCRRAEVLAGNGEGQLPAELRAAVLDPRPIGLGPRVRFAEVAVFSPDTNTLMVTDAVISLGRSPPPTVSRRDLLEWADDRNVAISGLRLLRLFGVAEKAREYGLRGARERLREGPEAACELGWMRMALTALYFGQKDVLRPQESFDRLAARKLVVPPVVATLVWGWDGARRDAGVAADVGRWAAEVRRLLPRAGGTTVLPGHFDVVRGVTPADWDGAFAGWLAAAEDGPGRGLGGLRAALWGRKEPWDYPAEDARCLRDVRRFLVEAGVIFTDATRPPRP